MNRRTSLLAVFLVLLLGGGAWYFTQATDEAKITKLIDGLVRAGDVSDGDNALLRAARVKSAIENAFAPDARVDVPELGGGGLGDITTAAVAAPHFLHDGSVRMSHLQITLDDAHAVAKVSGTATFDGHRDGGHKLAERPVDMQLRKIDGAWKIETVRTGAL